MVLFKKLKEYAFWRTPRYKHGALQIDTNYDLVRDRHFVFSLGAYSRYRYDFCLLWQSSQHTKSELLALTFAGSAVHSLALVADSFHMVDIALAWSISTGPMLMVNLLS